MSLPTQLGAYADCYELWSTADHLKVGCRTFIGPEYSKAEYLRMRMHQARKLLREQSKRAYPREHKLWNSSDYDIYKLTIKSDSDGNHWLYIELHGDWAAASNIEPIPPEELGAVPAELEPFRTATTLPNHPAHLQLEAIPNARQDDLE